MVGGGYSCTHAYPVRRSFGGKTKYYLVHIADHPDADWLINDLLAAVESRLFVASRDRETPGTLPGFIEEDDRQRVERLREALATEVIGVLASAPGQTMASEPLCVRLRDAFFGQLKQGDYSKVVKQLLKDRRVTREQEGIRPKLLPDDKITLQSS